MQGRQRRRTCDRAAKHESEKRSCRQLAGKLLSCGKNAKQSSALSAVISLPSPAQVIASLLFAVMGLVMNYTAPIRKGG